jgi:4-carboxymuconolactone decarboxylase
MPRIPYVDAAHSSPVADRMRSRRGGRLMALDRMLLHSPEAADGWNAFLGAIRGATSLDGKIRELIILRIAVLNGAPYEFRAHVPPARAAGAGEDWLQAIGDWEDSDKFSPTERAVLSFTDAITGSVSVPDHVFAGLEPHFSRRELVEIALVASAYNCVSRFLVAMGITEEADD